MVHQENFFRSQITKTVQLNYLLFLPERYGADPAYRWPLILFLHGSGERGDDLALLKLQGLPKKIDNWGSFPFVVVSPQCPANASWVFKLDALVALLDMIVSRYAVNEKCIYLTGISMGGHGVWQLAMFQAGRFAAIVPICAPGTGRPTIHLLKDTPVWAFHGAWDEVVPLSESERMVEALRAVGAEVRLTVYPEAGHDSWTPTYDNPALYEWLLSHTLR